MASEEHLAILRKGVESWNEWRQSDITDVIADLTEADLREIDLREADFSRTNFNRANLSGANLSGANLIGADLYKANFSRVNFTMADLSHAQLILTDLEESDLTGSDLSYANLSDTCLTRADLSGTDLSGACLSGTVFSGTNLSGLDLSRFDLSDAFLDNADLNEANLSGACLSGADLSGANLNDACLSGADLSGANFNKACLSGANFNKACLSKVDLSGFNLNGLNLDEVDLTFANLTITQALGANFTGATLTGACIEDWNINSATNLDNVICDYIYLKQNQQERRPSSGNFAPGEFTKLFQKALETVDLIFSDGIDWKAFVISLQELKAKYGEENLSVQAIEKKSGDAFVIRLEVPALSNKAEIESHAKLLYEQERKALEDNYRNQLQAKDREIEIHRQHNTSLENIIYALADRPIQNVAYSQSNSTLEEKRESNLNLQGAQFGGSLVNADTVNTGQIDGNTTSNSKKQAIETNVDINNSN